MLVDEIFAVYLWRTSQRVNDNFYRTVLTYTILFRECLNDLGWSKKIESESIKIEDEKFILAQFENNIDLSSGIKVLKELNISPDSIEYFDNNVFSTLDSISPNYINNLINKPYSKGYLLIGFRGADKSIVKGLSKAIKALGGISSNIQLVDENESEISLKHKLDNIESVALRHYDKGQRPIKILNSAGVPTNSISDFMNGMDALAKKLNTKLMFYGNVGEGLMSAIMLCDVNEVADRQSFFKLLSEASTLAVSLGGSLTAEGGLGRTATPYLSNEFSRANLEIFTKLKNIFDPQYILNPGVKFNTTEDDIKPLLTNKYYPKNLENN